MAQAKIGDTVKVHYTGKLEDGSIFDDSLNREPLKLKLGDKLLIEGFEQAVVGMRIDEWKTVKITAENAYGVYRKDLVLAANLKQLPADLKPVIGEQLQITQDKDNPPILVTVTDIADSKVILDANHPLAGKDLTFEIKLMEIVGA